MTPGQVVHVPLRHCDVQIMPARMETIFRDSTMAELDIAAGDNAHYRNIARRCGYTDHRRYAVHHDLTHSFLAEVLHDRPSPTLWAVAHGSPLTEAEAEPEERLVNVAQWTLATGDYRHNADYLRAQMGDGRWRGILRVLKRFLASVDRRTVPLWESAP